MRSIPANSGGFYIYEKTLHDIEMNCKNKFWIILFKIYIFISFSQKKNKGLINYNLFSIH